MRIFGLLACKSEIYKQLNANSNWIDLDFMERERTPEQAVELGIQTHVAGLSLSNTTSVLEGLGVKRSPKAVHDERIRDNRVKALPSRDTKQIYSRMKTCHRITLFRKHSSRSQRISNPGAIDETVIQINGQTVLAVRCYQNATHSG